MQSKTSHHRAAGVLLIVGVVLLAGCGSDHSSSSTSRATTSTPALACPAGQLACVSQSRKTKASGPQALDANLTKSMAKTDPTLRRVKLVCPRQAGYPIICRLTATDTRGGKPHPVAGTVKVLGVATSTRTYAYAVSYAPSR